MKTKDLAILTGIYAMNFLAAMTVLPFLPIFALTFPNVEAGLTGIFFAIGSFALTVGTIGGGWLAEKFQRRMLLVQISSVIAFVMFLLVQYATQFWQLTLLVSLAWFAIGVATTMVRVIAGILADKSERGRVFGIISASVPAMGLIAGISGGRIVDRWGFAALFTIISVAFVIQFVLSFLIEDVKVKPSTGNAKQGKQFQAGLSFWLLVSGAVVSYIALAAMIMGRPLLMDSLNFSGTAISGVLIAGGLVSLPMTFLVGTLSDRLGRKNMIMVCFLIAIPGLALLSIAEPLWHFWLSEMLIAGIGIANVVGFAYVADLVPQESLDTAMSYFSAASWIGTIIGYLFIGYLIDWFSISTMFLAATACVALSLIIVLPIASPVKLKIAAKV
ncbi:MAG: MFS transporter [Phototrophicaceae bacterium]